MRRVCFREHGEPDVLRVGYCSRSTGWGVTVPMVRLTRNEDPGSGVDLPHCPGGDVVGRVLAVGAGVQGWWPGRRAGALAASDAYAEQVAVPAAFATPVPEEITDEVAVCLVRSGQVALGVLGSAGLQLWACFATRPPLVTHQALMLRDGSRPPAWRGAPIWAQRLQARLGEGEAILAVGDATVELDLEPLAISVDRPQDLIPVIAAHRTRGCTAWTRPRGFQPKTAEYERGAL